MSLDQLEIGQAAIIKDLPADSPHFLKLLSLGILPGDQVEITGKAFLGGPITIKHSNNTFFALRKNHAKEIQVKVVE